MNEFFVALLFSIIAGLSTTIGSLITIFLKNPSNKFISLIMGFSAGVMILISFVELLQQGIASSNFLLGHIFFLIGMAFMFLIDITISHQYEFEGESLANDLKNSDSRAKSTSLLVTMGIFIHNFPEGMATFIGTLQSIELGTFLAFAIALHNIPEGIAVAVPVYTSTKSKRKAFTWSFLSGISEPIGALIVGLILYPFINEFILGTMLAIVGGFMIYISLDELLPASQSLGVQHLPILGIFIGMFVMAISLSML
ncbi:MAG: zinc transporter ZupT [Promethearchaeota archaeon]